MKDVTDEPIDWDRKWGPRWKYAADGHDIFQIHLDRKEFGSGNIIQGRKLMKILDEPKQIVIESVSKYWIVRMWRKLWGIKKTESSWMYTVKLIEDERVSE